MNVLDEKAVAAERRDCLDRFAAAVRAYRKNGGKSQVCIDYLKGIEERKGRDVALAQKRQLIAFANSGKPIPG